MNKAVVGSAVAMVIFAVIAAVGVIGMLGGRGEPVDPGAAAGTSQQETQVEQPLAVASRPDCPADPLVDLPCLGGKNSQPRAKVQVINVWAWWCEPCRKELPLLDAVAKRNGWQLVGVHADSNAANGAGFLEDLGLGMPSYQDSHNAFAGQLGLPGVVPITVVVVDGQERGRIIKAFDTEQDAEQAIRKLLS